MTSSPSILFADPDGWRVGRAEGDGASVSDAVIAPADAAPGDLAAALRANGYAGRPVVLALPSNACLCAPIATGDLPARQRGPAMLYRLEERLPVSAEDLVADFIPTGPAGALGVCMQRRPFQSLLDTLRAAGIASVTVASPRSLLALQHVLDVEDAAGQPAAIPVQSEMILWAEGSQLEAFLIGPDRLPRQWAVVPHEPDDLALHISMQSFGGGDPGDAGNGGARPERITACGVNPEVLDRLRQAFTGEIVTSTAVSTRALATLAARAVLARRLQPWVDLAQAHRAGGAASRGAFAQARGPLRWLVASAAVLMLSVLISLFWRAARYDQLATKYDARQQDIFRQSFAGQPVPRDVRSRLASEEQRLRTSAVAAGPADAARGRMSPADGLLVLRDLIAALPADVRFNLSELRLDGTGGRFTLLGETRSHGDAQAIADALRGGFEVESPRTELRAGGDAIGFTIIGGLAKRPAGSTPAALSSTAGARVEGGQ